MFNCYVSKQYFCSELYFKYKKGKQKKSIMKVNREKEEDNILYEINATRREKSIAYVFVQFLRFSRSSHVYVPLCDDNRPACRGSSFPACVPRATFCRRSSSRRNSFSFPHRRKSISRG